MEANYAVRSLITLNIDEIPFFFYLLLNEEFVLLDTFTMTGAGPFNDGNRFCFSLLSRQVDVTFDFGSFATFPFIFTPSFPFFLQHKHSRDI